VKVARFDRAALKEVERENSAGGARTDNRKVEVKEAKKSVNVEVKNVAKGIKEKDRALEVNDGLKGTGAEGLIGGSVEVNGGKPVVQVVPAGARAKEMSVRDVRVPLVVGTVNRKESGRGMEQEGKIVMQRNEQIGEQPSIQKLMRKYRSSEEDIQWARSGLTASVVRGQSIPDVQDRIEDAGFSDIDITPLGADRVFLRSLSGADVSSILSEAGDFFAHFFSNVSPWVKKALPFQMGAWLRLYGIPLHAWNEFFFFKLCVLDCGRLLRSDEGTMDRDIFDYAWVLIATSSLDIVHRAESILIDDEKVEMKIVEEWGFNIRDDVCLYEEREVPRSDQSNHEDLVEDVDHSSEANFLVDKIIEDLQHE